MILFETVVVSISFISLMIGIVIGKKITLYSLARKDIQFTNELKLEQIKHIYRRKIRKARKKLMRKDYGTK